MDWATRTILFWRLSNTLGARICVEAHDRSKKQGQFSRAEFVEVLKLQVCILRFICQRYFEWTISNQRRYTFQIMCMPRQRREAHQITGRIYQCHDLGGWSAAHASNGLSLGPRFALVAFRGNRMVAPYVACRRKIGVAAYRLEKHSKTSAVAFRRNCRNQLFQLPIAHGLSRQGDIARADQKSATKK